MKEKLGAAPTNYYVINGLPNRTVWRQCEIAYDLHTPIGV